MFSLPKVITRHCERTLQLSEKRRRVWLARINRNDLKNLDNIRVCGRHFVTGKPSNLMDDNNPDWAPSQHLGYGRDQGVLKKTERYERVKRRSRKSVTGTANVTTDFADASTSEDSDASGGPRSTDPAPLPSASLDERPSKDAEVQTELTGAELQAIQAENEKLTCQLHALEQRKHHLEAVSEALDTDNRRLAGEVRILMAKKDDLEVTEASLQQDDAKVFFYTGVANFALLFAIFQLVEVAVRHTPQHSLAKFQEFLVFLMKLKWNFPLQDLAYRFGISHSTVSRILERWLHGAFWRLQSQIVWPARRELQRTMPQEFVDSFGTKVAVIIDCFEIKIERPSSLLPRSETWSQYKGSNTAKFLIGISPQGSITFISEGWGGRTSDKHITEQCGLLDKLAHGDVVLADRGFDIADSVGLYCATLHIPAFTKGKNQLSALEVAKTRKLASVRIHVERVIGLVRNKFIIMKAVQPVDFVTVKSGDKYTTLDKIVTVCCALANLCPSVVPANMCPSVVPANETNDPER